MLEIRILIHWDSMDTASQLQLLPADKDESGRRRRGSA